MTSRNQDFTLWLGDSKNLEVIVTDEDGNPKNIADASIKWKMSDLTNTLEKETEGSGIVITEASAGKFTISISPTDTPEFGEGYYYHEAEMIDAGGDVSTVLVGNACLKKGLIEAVV